MFGCNILCISKAISKIEPGPCHDCLQQARRPLDEGKKEEDQLAFEVITRHEVLIELSTDG